MGSALGVYMPDEGLFGNAVEPGKPAFGEAPEGLDSVGMMFSPGSSGV